jgi:hypothetical protein
MRAAPSFHDGDGHDQQHAVNQLGMEQAVQVSRDLHGFTEPHVVPQDAPTATATATAAGVTALAAIVYTPQPDRENGDTRDTSHMC